MRALSVSTASATYKVTVGSGLLATLAARIAKVPGKASARTRRVFVVTSSEIWALWSQQFLASFDRDDPPTVLFLPAGERYKRLSQVERLLEELAAARADRSSLLVAFGGGIVGDVGGFLAAVYMRGIDYVQVPTTLLAQVDSSVGGKTGVNLAAGKNLAGSFHHPLAVFADIDLLGTLPDRELRAGLYESIKGGIIRDRTLFRLMEREHAAILARGPKLLEQVVARSVALKAEIVGLDERESGLRMILNLGHTVGHAIEAATGYKALLHGEAIGWGMLVALHVALSRATVTQSEAEWIRRTLALFGPLPGFHTSARALLKATASDKKHFGGMRRFVLPRGIGDAVVIDDLAPHELETAIEAMLAEVPKTRA